MEVTMFTGECVELCVFYGLSPLHAGSGQAIGAVDLPIQRERHTNWPHVQSSGVKGAFRDWFQRYYQANAHKCSDLEVQAKELTERVFGKEESGESLAGQAGAMSITDARLLAFPVRSNVAPFVWVTCPAVLSRLDRDLRLCSSNMAVPVIGLEENDGYVAVHDRLKDRMILEDLVVSPQKKLPTETKQPKDLFAKLAPHVDRLAVISDENYTFLVTTATEIQPQIEIDFDTGTTTTGSLRHEELLPADSVLYCLVFFGTERKDPKETPLAPTAIRDCVKAAISTHIQMGGDMTLGRGLMEVRWFNGKSTTGGAT
jgi:CRISPR-associated protein Cmr4